MSLTVSELTNTVEIDDGRSTVTVEVAAPATISITAPGPQGATGAQGPAGATGATGPAGPQGQPGQDGADGQDGVDGADGSALTFVYEQATASAEWTIEHNLNAYLNLTVVDSAGTQVEGNVTYQDANTVVVQFAAPFTGTAFLS